MRLYLAALAVVTILASAAPVPLTGATHLAAAETERKVPRFVSLRANEVNLRTGPGRRYPIEWVYHKRGLPIEITAEFDKWRRIRDHEGTTGWVHQSLLSGRRNALITEARLLRSKPDDDARPLAQLSPGVLAELISCEENWCRLEVNNLRGWIRQDQFFGALAGESVDN